MNPERSSFLKWIYIITLIFMAFSGFGQMPIFKRYYISDIPGLGWSANFYITHFIHYIGAIILFILFTYAITDYFLITKRDYKLTKSAYIRIFLFIGIVITGLIKVFKNFNGIVLPPKLIVFTNLTHLGLIFTFLFTVLILKILKSGNWLIKRS